MEAGHDSTTASLSPGRPATAGPVYEFSGRPESRLPPAGDNGVNWPPWKGGGPPGEAAHGG